MGNQPSEFVAVSITREEARVWSATVVAHLRRERFNAPTDWRRHRHPCKSMDRRDREAAHDKREFFEAVTEAGAPSAHILVLGHGRGKANVMLQLIQYWGRRDPAVAMKVVGAIDSDLEALSDNQILALAHEWYAEHPRLRLSGGSKRETVLQARKDAP